MTEAELWARLYELRAPDLFRFGTNAFVKGFRRLSLHGLPDVNVLAGSLWDASGWTLVPCPGASAMPARHFFSHLARHEFPIVTALRSADQVGWCREPDLWHEVMHLAQLVDRGYSALQHGFGMLSLALDDARLERLARLYWRTMEFGLSRDKYGMRIVGASPLSSHEECQSVKSAIDGGRVLPFDPDGMVASPICETGLQDVYYEVDANVVDIYEALDEGASWLA